MSYITKAVAPFKRKPASIKQNLADKSIDLRAEVDTHSSISESLIRAAAEEKQQARTKATHATAVEQAYAILDKAGVEL